MYDFKGASKKATQTSKVLAGREKLTTDEVMRLYPNGVTVEMVDLLNGANGSYPVFAIKDTKNYFNGGSVAVAIVNEWLSGFDGDIEKLNAELQTAGVTFKLTKERTKRGNTVVKYEVI